MRTGLIYISTDEQNKAWFEPFSHGTRQHGYKLVFLHDFLDKVHLPPGHNTLNKNHLGNEMALYFLLYVMMNEWHAI
jgi:hypothetical protein